MPLKTVCKCCSCCFYSMLTRSGSVFPLMHFAVTVIHMISVPIPGHVRVGGVVAPPLWWYPRRRICTLHHLMFTIKTVLLGCYCCFAVCQIVLTCHMSMSKHFRFVVGGVRNSGSVVCLYDIFRIRSVCGVVQSFAFCR